MNRDFDYRQVSRSLLALGIILSILMPWFGWLPMVGAGVSFVFAIICHTSHVGQQQMKEALEIRKRLMAIEDRLEMDRPSPPRGG